MTAAHITDSARVEAVASTGLLDTDPEVAFDALTTLAASLLEAPFAFMTLVDDERSYWKSRFGIDDPMLNQNRVEESFCQYVIASGEPLIVGDVTANPLTANNPSIQSMGVAAWAGYPLHGPDGHVLGSFCVVDTVVRQWTDRDIEVLRVLSEAAGRELALRAAIRQAQAALEDRDASNARFAFLAEIGQLLADTNNTEEALQRLASLVVPLLGDWSLVSIVDSEDETTLRDVGWWHADEHHRPTVAELVAGRQGGLAAPGPIQAVRQAVMPIVATTGALDDGLRVLTSPRARAALQELNPVSYAIFPLSANGVVHGVIAILRGPDREPMPEADVALMSAAAHRVGLAFENTRLYARQQAISDRLMAANARIRESARHDRRVARALQDAMLTRLPEPDHLHLTSRYLTADSSDQVGGDWYDALIPASGATTLMIGDVAGHDISAAAVMGQLRNMLRAFAWEHPEATPAELITRLDRAMWDLNIRQMTTLAVLRIEQSSDEAATGMRTVRWSRAGHPPPLLLDPSTGPRYLDSPADPPLAVRRDGAASREDHSCQITPGSTLLLFTDGLVEGRGTDYDGRLAQLLDTVGTSADLPLEDLLDTVLSSLSLPDADDDIALLAVRFHPQDQPRPASAGPAHP